MKVKFLKSYPLYLTFSGEIFLRTPYSYANSTNEKKILRPLILMQRAKARENIKTPYSYAKSTKERKH